MNESRKVIREAAEAMGISPSELVRHAREVARACKSIVPLDDYVVRFNGGRRCDVEIGPCACGAWHDGTEYFNRTQTDER